jgi:hypothetical protein
MTRQDPILVAVPQRNPHLDPRNSQDPGSRSGAPLPDPGPDEAAWRELAGRLAGALAGMGPRQFLIVEHQPSGRDGPYAQATGDGHGYYCELSNPARTPGGLWPVDHLAIRRQGWAAPDQTTPNWWTLTDDAAQAARRILGGLRHAHRCADPHTLTRRIGTFPTGGGDGGEPLPIPTQLAA